MRFVTAALAIATGLIVLSGYFFPNPQLDVLRLWLTDWAIVIAAMAILVGIVNLVAVQMEKVRSRGQNGVYGLILIFSLVITFTLGMILKPDHPWLQLTLNAIIVPGEASLMALLAVTLIYASIRLFRYRFDLTSILFLVTTLIALIAIVPTPFGPLPGSAAIRQLTELLSSGGARGLLLGIALGTLLTGLRVLFGIDRPYGGN